MDVGELEADAVGDLPFLRAGVDEQQIFLPVVEEAEIALGSSLAWPEATGGASGVTIGKPFGGASNSMRRRGGAPSALRAMKARMRSSVSVVMRPPLRSRLASLPSLTARRPKVDSASPRWRQNSLISCRICSFMARFPETTLAAVYAGSEPSHALRVKCWERWAKWVGKIKSDFY